MTRRANQFPTPAENTQGLLDAISQSQVPVPKPDDMAGSFVFTVVAPVLIALLLVFLLFIFNPEAVLTKEQMEDYKEAELDIEKKKRGVKEPARQSRDSRRRQRRTRKTDSDP